MKIDSTKAPLVAVFTQVHDVDCCAGWLRRELTEAGLWEYALSKRQAKIRKLPYERR